MDPSNFDEFGNYIGPELSGSDDVRHLSRPQGNISGFPTPPALEDLVKKSTVNVAASPWAP